MSSNTRNKDIWDSGFSWWHRNLHTAIALMSWWHSTLLPYLILLELLVVSWQKQTNQSLANIWQWILKMFIYHVVTDPLSSLNMVMLDLTGLLMYQILLGTHLSSFLNNYLTMLMFASPQTCTLSTLSSHRSICKAGKWETACQSQAHGTSHWFKEFCQMQKKDAAVQPDAQCMAEMRMHRGTSMTTVCIWLWTDMFIVCLQEMDPMFLAKKNMPCVPISKTLTLVW